MTTPNDQKPHSPASKTRGEVDVQCLVRHVDLCSGIGGFALASKWVGGIETILFCEIDQEPRNILNKTFPGVPIHHDVKTLDLKNYGRIDLITAGYPCQPFSNAGKQKGEDDDRHLWPEIFRAIKEGRPRWALCENVDGHVGMGLDEVLSDLEGAGYTTEPIIIPACAVNAPHRRDRVWIIAHDNSQRCDDRGNHREERQISSDIQRDVEKDQSDGSQFISRVSAIDKDSTPSHIDRQRSQGQGELRGSVHPEQDQKGQINRAQYDPQFQRPWMETATELCRVDDGIPKKLDEPRIKGLGNAIVPQVAAEILRVMMTVDKQSNRELTCSRSPVE